MKLVQEYIALWYLATLMYPKKLLYKYNCKFEAS